MTTEKSHEIAILGGSFNPPTIAHQAIIAACLKRPEFDEVWVMPSGERYDKDIDASDNDRLAMLQAMKRDVFANDPRLSISDFEMGLPRPSETYRTVGALAAAHADTRFWFVYGADSYQTMPSWRHGDELRAKLSMLVIARPGYAMPESTERIRHLQMPEAVTHYSSTIVREAVRAEQRIEDFVCGAVARYIDEFRLYRAA
jgi:nicotinate-nucleotide adenylyltransferase